MCVRVIEHRLKNCMSIAKNQFGFMLGRSTIKAIHSMRQTMKCYRVRQKEERSAHDSY